MENSFILNKFFSLIFCFYFLFVLCFFFSSLSSVDKEYEIFIGVIWINFVVFHLPLQLPSLSRFIIFICILYLLFTWQHSLQDEEKKKQKRRSEKAFFFAAAKRNKCTQRFMVNPLEADDDNNNNNEYFFLLFIR